MVNPSNLHIFSKYSSFLSKADKKLPGAEKRSQFYVKHGNPNYGGKAYGLSYYFLLFFGNVYIE